MHEGGSSYSSDRFDIAWGLASNQHRVIVDPPPLDVQGFFSARCANAMGEPESEIGRPRRSLAHSRMFAHAARELNFFG
jgi:hypothetical protein